jgi:hypothetical protein
LSLIACHCFAFLLNVHFFFFWLLRSTDCSTLDLCMCKNVL